MRIAAMSLVCGTTFVLGFYGCARSPQRFEIAVARLDGRLVPFAAYAQGQWQAAWPSASRSDEEPERIEDVASIWRQRNEKVPDVWRVWPQSGAPVIETHIKGVEVVAAHCVGQVALRTDLPALKEEHPLKFGVAVDTSLTLHPLLDIKQSEALWKMAERAVGEKFGQLEREKIDRDKPRLNYDPTPSETPQPAIVLDELVGDITSPGSPLFFRAARKYRTPISASQSDETPTTIIEGWLMPAGTASFRMLTSNVTLIPWEETESDAVLPLAAFRVGQMLFWVVEIHGYEDERYAIAELSDRSSLSTDVQRWRLLTGLSSH